MKQKTGNIPYFLLILFITIVTVFDLFANVGRSANMDGLAHTTTIGMFYKVLSAGEFPVGWVDGFANYGMPLSLIAHQVPNYLGAFINFITQNPALSFNIVCFIGLLISNILFYVFLRFYFNPMYAFLGTFIFNFAPYRIINLYIRGAIPEAFSNIFLPLILMSIYLLVKKKNIYGLFFIALSIAALSLAHPLTLVTFSFVFLPYLFFLLVFENDHFNIKALFTKRSAKIMAIGIIAIIIGIGIAGYYILPLQLEIKYFYYGSSSNHLTENQYLGLKNYFDPNWYYYTKAEIFPRGHFIQAGLIETLAVIVGFFYLLYKWFMKREKTFTMLEFSVGTSILIIFMTTSYSDFLYRHINILSNIQFPWRMLSSLMFLPPIILTYLFSKYNKTWAVLLFIIIICIARFPQLYGKNYTYYPTSFYYFTANNLHSTLMNTVWTGKTEDYPIKHEKPAIIEGEGEIVTQEVKNSYRKYTINAQTPLRMVDYTFYFPGWNVAVDNVTTPIEFQDPKYRGVITYAVPQGRHTIDLTYSDTRVRQFGKIISIISLVLFVILFIARTRIARYLL